MEKFNRNGSSDLPLPLLSAISARSEFHIEIGFRVESVLEGRSNAKSSDARSIQAPSIQVLGITLGIALRSDI